MTELILIRTFIKNFAGIFFLMLIENLNYCSQIYFKTFTFNFKILNLVLLQSKTHFQWISLLLVRLKLILKPSCVDNNKLKTQFQGISWKRIPYGFGC